MPRRASSVGDRKSNKKYKRMARHFEHRPFANLSHAREVRVGASGLTWRLRTFVGLRSEPNPFSEKYVNEEAANLDEDRDLPGKSGKAAVVKRQCEVAPFAIP